MSDSPRAHIVHVGIGSNVERELNIRSGVAALRQHFGEVAVSPVYESAAVGFDGDPFYNLVAHFSTDSSIDVLGAVLRQIEDQHQRDRTLPSFSPRTLDIDLLLYGDVVLQRGKLQLPRGEITRHAFVLRPLAELSGDLVHPLQGISYGAMWQQFDQRAQPLTAVSLEW